MPLAKVPLSFAIRMSSALVSSGLNRSVSHLALAKPWILLMTHLRLYSASGIPGQAVRTSHGYGMHNRIESCGTHLLILSVCIPFIMSTTRFSSPHRPGGGLDSRALNFWQTSCIVHFSRKFTCRKTRPNTSSGSFVSIATPMPLQASAVVAQ